MLFNIFWLCLRFFVFIKYIYYDFIIYSYTWGTGPLGYGLNIRKLDTGKGAILQSIEPDSPAANSCAILAGDHLVSINGIAGDSLGYSDVISILSSELFLRLEIRQDSRIQVCRTPARSSLGESLGITVDKPTAGQWLKIVKVRNSVF